MSGNYIIWRGNVYCADCFFLTIFCIHVMPQKTKDKKDKSGRTSEQTKVLFTEP